MDIHIKGLEKRHLVCFKIWTDCEKVEIFKKCLILQNTPAVKASDATCIFCYAEIQSFFYVIF